MMSCRITWYCFSF